MNDVRIEYMRLDDFLKRFHPDNPKEHDLEGIGKSVDRFGFVEVPTLDERTGFVVAGHGRGEGLNAAMIRGEQPPARISKDKDGMWLLPVLRGITFNSDAEVKAYLAASNRLTEKGGWNMEKLLALRDAIDDPDLWSTTGFGEDVFGDLAQFGSDNDLDLSEFDGVNDFEIRYRVVIHDLTLEAANDLAETLQAHNAKVEQYRVKKDATGEPGSDIDF